MIYVAGKHTASASGSLRTDYLCKHCGYTEPVDVFAFARAQTESPYFIGAESARREAQRQAEAGVERLAKHHLKMVTCPACGGYDRATRVLAAIPSAFLGLFHWPLAVLIPGLLIALDLGSWLAFYAVVALWVLCVSWFTRSHLKEDIREAETALLLKGPTGRRKDAEREDPYTAPE